MLKTKIHKKKVLFSVQPLSKIFLTLTDRAIGQTVLLWPSWIKPLNKSVHSHPTLRKHLTGRKKASLIWISKNIARVQPNIKKQKLHMFSLYYSELHWQTHNWVTRTIQNKKCCSTPRYILPGTIIWQWGIRPLWFKIIRGVILSIQS